jgi:hypothetical protein
MFPIFNHVKNNNQFVLAITDNTQDLNIARAEFMCMETFRNNRSLKRFMALSSSNYFFPYSTGLWPQDHHLESIQKPFFVMGFFQVSSSQTIFLGWIPLILLISASWVARITGISHKWLLDSLDYNKFALLMYCIKEQNTWSMNTAIKMSIIGSCEAGTNSTSYNPRYLKGWDLRYWGLNFHISIPRQTGRTIVQTNHSNVDCWWGSRAECLLCNPELCHQNTNCPFLCIVSSWSIICDWEDVDIARMEPWYAAGDNKF